MKVIHKKDIYIPSGMYCNSNGLCQFLVTSRNGEFVTPQCSEFYGVCIVSKNGLLLKTEKCLLCVRKNLMEEPNA